MSKAEILKAIRAAQMPAVALPPLDDLGTPFADPPGQFAIALKAAAGECLPLTSFGALDGMIRQRYPQAQVIYSAVEGLPSRGFELPADADPHAFATVDLSVVRGAIGVAENGAVWLPLTVVAHPACLLLAQHLLIVLRAADIVSTMHQAYARLAREPMSRFGTFIAGPSKTADIEQCLVIGAHGARSLTVLLA